MDENIFVTILVLCALVKYGEAYKLEWRMIANKAKKSLMNGIAGPGVSIQKFNDLSTQLQAAI